MVRLAAWLFVWLVLATACGTPQPKSQRQGQAQVAAPAADADSEAVAALRTWATGGRAEQALTLAKRAAERDPQRADLAWLQVRLCAETKGCEPEPLETRLRKLDPGNGVAWLGALARAQTRRDTRAAEQILEAMSRSERFDLYWTTLISRLSVALTNMASADSKDPLTTALNETTTWLSKLAAPALKPITTACNQQRVRESATMLRCQRIAQAMRDSDTTLVEGIGLALAQRLTEPASRAGLTLDERIATLSYQSQAAGAIVQAQIERDKFSAQMIELMKKLRREQEVASAILRWAGRPTTPP